MAVMLTVPLYMGFKDAEETVTETGENVQTETPQENNSAQNETPTENNSAQNEKPAENTPAQNETPTTEKPGLQSQTMMKDYMNQFEGKTIVNIEYEGASDSTLPTVKAAIMAAVGDEFSADIALRDRAAIINTGYFYEAYQTFREVPEGVIVTYHTMENPILKKIEITGNTLYKTEELNKILTVRRNSIVNRNTLNSNLAAIEEKYHQDGYILMKITDMNVSTDGVLTLKINEGTLEGYSVKGNKKTKDRVVLREMRQKVGEPFNAKLARRSMDRVYNLGFFEDVNMKMQPGVEPNAIVLEVNVKERRTGTFGIGAGYSTRDGLLGSVSISDTNFRGTGDAISLSFEKSAEESDAHGFTFAYKRPWIDSRETAATVRYYNRTYQFYDYDTAGDLQERYMRKYSGGEVTLSRPQSEYSTNYITVRHRKDAYVRHVSSGNAGDRSGLAGEAWRKANFGTTRAIIAQHVTDTRDNIYNPSTGGRVALTAEFGGLWGGDFTFQKYDIDHQQFFKAGDHSQVWAFKSAYGLGHGDLTEFNQFRVGGQNTLRGYRDDQFRGNRMLLTTLEYRFPLAKKIQGIIFTDWGGTWNDGFVPKGGDIYGSAGLGVALNTPLGPLRLDYGRGSQGGRFHFNIGGGF
ncbi:MAG: BamA/TamA family outer membrane protein [Selenomonadaceae bacterium]|nr:BamA/TamA family outer membrane protein [Selenomonadaceae bacterium]